VCELTKTWADEDVASLRATAPAVARCSYEAEVVAPQCRLLPRMRRGKCGISCLRKPDAVVSS